jgi:hypothetical protein
VTDWYNEGYGILACKGVGKVTSKRDPATGRRVESAFGDLYMHYRMIQAKHEAEMQGDTIAFEQQRDGTYIAKVETAMRLGL